MAAAKAEEMTAFAEVAVVKFDPWDCGRHQVNLAPGHVYSCYKLAEKSFWSACQKAANSGIQQTYRQLDFLISHGTPQHEQMLELGA